MRLAVFIVLSFVACAAGQVTPKLPGTFGTGEPLPPPVAPEAGGTATPALPPGAGADPGAEADFNDARAKFDAGDRAGARAALEAFVANHPQHAFRPTVDLMLARLALVRGDAAAAKTLLEPLATPAEANAPAPGATPVATGASSARYYLGLAEVRMGQAARGRELLLPFLPSPAPWAPGTRRWSSCAGRWPRPARRWVSCRRPWSSGTVTCAADGSPRRPTPASARPRSPRR